MTKHKTRPLPDVPDPNDMDAKRKLNPQADDLNFIDDRGRLVCGAKPMNRDGKCRSSAGAGTAHKGYGRCKRHGGSCTGPRTEEGKAVVSKNALKHGFYSKALNAAERETYENLEASKDVSLLPEINMLKAKILHYLLKWRKVYDEALEGWKPEVKPPDAEDGWQPRWRSAEDYAESQTRTWYTAGIDQERAYYHAGTADDKTLHRQLETLRRLVDSHAKLSPQQGAGLLDSINAELRNASHGAVTLGWSSRPAQQRKEGQT